MKATVLAESSSYFLFCLGYLRYVHVYRRESGRCRSFPFFLKFFIIISFLVFLLCQHCFNNTFFVFATICWLILMALVVLGKHARIGTQCSLVQTQMKLMDFLRHKCPEHKSSRRDFKPWILSLRFQGH